MKHNRKDIMFKKNKPLEEAKQRLMQELAMYDPTEEEYEKILDRLHKLNSVPSRSKVNADTIAIVLGNLFGILVIVAYEQKHVFASKASNFIMKVK